MSKLYIIPTPIGNLEDITLRALRILKEVNIILAEDTRTTGNLLKHFSIENKLQSHHLHNEHKMVEQVVERIQNGETVALVSDAGTPAISDPGFLLVRECIKNGIDVDCLPGATAFVPALVNSGLPCETFVFNGFLPQKKGRQKKLKHLAEEERTIVLYESTYRIKKLLEELNKSMPDRLIVVARELTKKFEETWRGTASQLLQNFEKRITKGEFVILLAPLNWKEI